MLGALKSLFSGKVSGAAPFRPDHPLAVVGDVHGCPHLLDDALRRIEGHRATLPDGDALKTVMLGDYVDRGDDGAAVLARLYDLQIAQPGQVLCLMGNHERMMLDFIKDPAAAGPRWIRNGGLQTLASYRIGGLRETSDAVALTDARDELLHAIPAGMLDWLTVLPLIYQSGNICCVHAAMDPALGPQAQQDEVLLWGNADFLRKGRGDNLWVAHGHTIVEQPMRQHSRIALDTGAYATGQLSVGVITTDECVFL